MDKIEIRKNIRQKLDSLTNEDLVKNSKMILNNLRELDIFQKAESIFIFNSIKKEPRTKELIDECLRSGKKVYVPTIIFDEIYPVEIFQDTRYYTGKYEILEPYGDVFFGDIDITIVPLTAFDNNLNRVGKGGGYYDKYLKNKPTIKLGLAYSFMQVDEIISYDYDVPLDAVITEKDILLSKKYLIDENIADDTTNVTSSDSADDLATIGENTSDTSSDSADDLAIENADNMDIKGIGDTANYTVNAENMQNNTDTDMDNTDITDGEIG